MTNLHWLLLGQYVLAVFTYYCSQRWHDQQLADARNTGYMEPRWGQMLCALIWPILGIIMCVGTMYDFLVTTRKT